LRELSQQPLTQGGPLLAGFHPVVPDNGYHNFLAAFRKRCNFHSNARATPRIVASSTDFINKLIPTIMPTFEWTPGRFEEWNSSFGAEKQARMVAALERQDFSSVSDYKNKDVFVKTEALLVRHKPNWAPRVIYKGSDIYNAISGPMFKELMLRLTTRLESQIGDRDYRFKVAYKQTPDKFLPHIEAATGDFMECDFSANDMTQCADVQLLELMLMRRLGCPEWFCRLHSKTNQFKVRSRNHGVTATLENQLPTGCTDTTFRNSFWNACILYAFLVSINAPACRALILGDDMLARISRLPRYAAKTYAGIASEARMDAKVFRRRALVNCSFLSKSLVPNGNHHVAVPLLGKALARFNMRANRNSAVSDAAYFAGKAVGYAYEFRHCPDLRDLFLLRFDSEWQVVKQERSKPELVLSGVTWNAREAGITLSNIKQKIFVDDVLSAGSFHVFTMHRYSLSGSDVVAAFRYCITETGPDLDGPVAELLVKDFI